MNDLLRFAQALESGKLVKPTTLAEWTGPSEKNPNYGYGIEIYDSEGKRAYGHRGGFPGVSSLLHVDRNSGTATVILSNVGNGSLPVAEKLRDLSAQW